MESLNRSSSRLGSPRPPSPSILVCRSSGWSRAPPRAARRFRGHSPLSPDQPGVMLASFGAATLVHFLVVSVSRRRREMGLLKVLGFVRHQVVSAVDWQATILALVGIVIGVPLGVVVGREAWKAFASNLGVVGLRRACVDRWGASGGSCSSRESACNRTCADSEPLHAESAPSNRVDKGGV